MLKIRLLAIILLLSSVSLCLGDEDSNEKDVDGKERFHYEIEVISNHTEDFLIHFPVPIISRHNHPNKGEPTLLMNELSVESGSVNYDIVNTDHGYALELKSNESFLLSGHRELPSTSENEDDYVFGELSMKNGEKGYSPYYVNYTSDSTYNVVVNFLCYWESIPAGCETFEYGLSDYSLSEGWNSIDMLDDGKEV